MIKISIIVPIYNAEKYIEKTVKQLLNQTYKNIEIILVNDGSTDKTMYILKKLENNDERIVVCNKKNEGPSSARNYGIRIATGEYICFCDSDDILDINFLKDMVNILKRIEYDFLTVSFSNLIYKNESLISNVKVGIEEKEMANNQEVKTHYFFGIINSYTHSPVGKLYKLNKIRENNIFFKENMLFGEDLLFNLDYINVCNNAYNISESYYEYIQIDNPNRLTQRKDINKFDIYYSWRNQLISFIENINIVDKNTFLKLMFNQWFISGINSIMNNKKLVSKEIEKYINYDPIITNKGFKDYIISLVIKTKSKSIILLFCKFVRVVKKRFKLIYYKVMANSRGDGNDV